MRTETLTTIAIAALTIAMNGIGFYFIYVANHAWAHTLTGWDIIDTIRLCGRVMLGGSVLGFAWCIVALVRRP